MGWLGSFQSMGKVQKKKTDWRWRRGLEKMLEGGVHASDTQHDTAISEAG